METLILEVLTDEKVSYRYYPEDGEEYGIVSLNRKTGERTHDLVCPGSISLYARQAWSRLDEYQASSRFPKRDLVAWC